MPNEVKKAIGRHGLGVFLLVAAVAAAAPGRAGAGEGGPDNMLDFTRAVVVAPADLTGPERKAVEMLVDEVERRSFVRWPVVHEWPGDAHAVIIVGSAAAIGPLTGPFSGRIAPPDTPRPDGYRVQSASAGTVGAALVAGDDARGTLFGVGRLLRELRITKHSVLVPDGLHIDTAPRYPLRGHQFGYRPKVNTYDGWTVAMFEQYIRDLVVFGANAVEVMPPRTDDDADSPHFTLPPIDMMAAVSQLAADYGLEFWIWYPAMDPDYSKAETVQAALAEWGAVFERLPHITAVFVPGGDPGHTQPKHLMALLEKEAEVLHRTHPNATMWMAPQGFDAEWMDEFLGIMRGDQPDWLTGIVFGPQVRMSLPELRKAIPEQYPIRRYPDITHTIRCQYPVPDWDIAYVRTQDREVINPRPTQYANIFRLWQDEAVGFITYSEGVNDDVNKAVWSALGWDPDVDVTGVLREYGRYFIGAPYADDFAQILLALERNWSGPLLTNDGVNTTLQQVCALEARVTPQVQLLWRFQQVVYRAHYDAFVRTRLVYETDLEERAMDALRRAEALGSPLAMDEAERILNRARTEPVAQDLRARVFEMAEALYQSIRMQLSVPRYKAIAVGRGANLDLIDRPLNSADWLKARFAEIRAIESEPARLAAIAGILNWANPGPGGFYDDLGNPSCQPHLIRPCPIAEDPECRVTAYCGFDDEPNMRISSSRFGETRFDTPLRMRYTGLDPEAGYTLRVVYGGDNHRPKVRCDANDRIEVHPFIAKKYPPEPLDFDLPREATRGGTLDLAWRQEPGAGGNGRGCQVAEVWLVKKGR